MNRVQVLQMLLQVLQLLVTLMVLSVELRRLCSAVAQARPATVPPPAPSPHPPQASRWRTWARAAAERIVGERPRERWSRPSAVAQMRSRQSIRCSRPCPSTTRRLGASSSPTPVHREALPVEPASFRQDPRLDGQREFPLKPRHDEGGVRLRVLARERVRIEHRGARYLGQALSTAKRLAKRWDEARLAHSRRGLARPPDKPCLSDTRPPAARTAPHTGRLA